MESNLRALINLGIASVGISPILRLGAVRAEET